MDQISYFPAVVVVGPRQVGKTTLIKTLQSRLPRPSVYLDLEIPSQSARPVSFYAVWLHYLTG